jgi:hypothetical protein
LNLSPPSSEVTWNGPHRVMHRDPTVGVGRTQPQTPATEQQHSQPAHLALLVSHTQKKNSKRAVVLAIAGGGGEDHSRLERGKESKIACLQGFSY